MVAVFLSKGYISSRNCRRELARAYAVDPSLVVLIETDAHHGAPTIEDLEKEFKAIFGNRRAAAKGGMAEGGVGAASAATDASRPAASTACTAITLADPKVGEERACRALLERVRAGDVLQWHREAYLKRVTLMQVLQRVCDKMVGPDAHVMAHRELHRQALADQTVYLSELYEQPRQPQQAGAAPPDGRVDSGVAPDEYSELRNALVSLGCRCLPASGSVYEADATAPAILLLSPEVFSAGREELVAHISSLLEFGSHRPVLALASTAVPFEVYVAACPDQLQALGLFRQIFLKWVPGEPSLQEATVRHGLSKLLPRLRHRQAGRWKPPGWRASGVSTLFSRRSRITVGSEHEAAREDDAAPLASSGAPTGRSRKLTAPLEEAKAPVPHVVVKSAVVASDAI